MRSFPVSFAVSGRPPVSTGGRCSGLAALALFYQGIAYALAVDTAPVGGFWLLR